MREPGTAEPVPNPSDRCPDDVHGVHSWRPTWHAEMDMVVASCTCGATVAAVDPATTSSEWMHDMVRFAMADLGGLEDELERRTEFGDHLWNSISKLEIGENDILILEIPKDMPQEAMLDLRDYLSKWAKPFCRGVMVVMEGTRCWHLSEKELAGMGYAPAPRMPDIHRLGGPPDEGPAS